MTDIATDLDIAAWHRWVDNEPDEAVGTHCTAGEIKKLLNRIAASEAENAALKERERPLMEALDDALFAIQRLLIPAISRERGVDWDLVNITRDEARETLVKIAARQLLAERGV